jgi:hypothetical protein
MLADDFLGGIALDAFAAGVPVRDDAGRIKRRDFKRSIPIIRQIL